MNFTESNTVYVFTKEVYITEDPWVPQAETSWENYTLNLNKSINISRNIDIMRL